MIDVMTKEMARQLGVDSGVVDEERGLVLVWKELGEANAKMQIKANTQT